MHILTPRLEITDLTDQHAVFILKLLNTPDWLKYIGDKHVYTLADAQKYVNDLANSSSRNYWPVLLAENDSPIGIITLIQRDYLAYPDFGFAFLPEYYQLGYAFEASSATLEYLINTVSSQIHGITLIQNEKSINLLKKLGFVLEKEFIKDGEPLFLFTLQRDARL